MFSIFFVKIKITAMNENMYVPDEDTYMKMYLKRLFTVDFFIDKISLNARKGKVMFKNTILLHCFAGKSTRYF